MISLCNFNACWAENGKEQHYLNFNPLDKTDSVEVAAGGQVIQQQQEMGGVQEGRSVVAQKHQQASKVVGAATAIKQQQARLLQGSNSKVSAATKDQQHQPGLKGQQH